MTFKQHYYLCKKGIESCQKQTLYILEPIFPDPNKSTSDNKEYLYNATLEAMKKCADSISQYEYIKYIHVEKDEDKQ